MRVKSQGNENQLHKTSILINEHLERISPLNRIDLITEKDSQQKLDRIPLVITYNQFLPNTTKTITKNWNILQIH